MKPHVDTLAVVTATANPGRAADCLQSWLDRAHYEWPLIIEVNGYQSEPYLGVVPAFAKALRKALETKAEVIALLHDDLFIKDDGWDATVLAHFELRPTCGLAGFGGGRTLGHPAIYQIPYEPHQLARGTFISNMEEAEAHGARVVEPQTVACLDGFSQIGRREYWLGEKPGGVAWPVGPFKDRPNLFQRMADLGLMHHAYDAALGCYARRLGWDAWMLPVHCHHYGGVTAVADTRYHEWAVEKRPMDTEGNTGDEGFWHDAHEAVYEEFRDVLPFGVLP